MRFAKVASIGLAVLGPSLTCLGEEWSVTSQMSFSLENIQGTPHSLSPDGTVILSAGNEAGLCLYRAADLSPLGCYKPPEGTESPLWLRLRSITWSPSGGEAVFSVFDGRLWRIQVSTGKLEWLPASAPAEYAAYSPDGSCLAVGGGGYIVVAPPGALAEAPVARYKGILKGLVWRGGTLYYGVLAPDRKTFQLWAVSPRGNASPELLWSYPHPELLLVDVSPDGRYAWIGAALVDLVAGELVRVREKANVQSFVFSQDGASWLYAYSTVKDLKLVWVLAIRQAGDPEGEEEVLLELEKPIRILGWASTGRVALFLPHSREPGLMVVDLVAAGCGCEH